MPVCVVALGANLGDRTATLQLAISQLEATPQIHILQTSRWVETVAVGGPAGQSTFLNGAVRLETTLSPEQLLAVLQSIETDLGRQRHVHWGPRVIDLDLLLYDERQIHRPDLIVPHPRMAFRRFVLQPAAEVAGQHRHAPTGWTIEQLYQHLQNRPPYAAVAAPPGFGQTEFVQTLEQLLGVDTAYRQTDAQIKPAAKCTTGDSVDLLRPCMQQHAEQLLKHRILSHSQADTTANIAANKIADSKNQTANWLVSDFWLPEFALYASSDCTPREVQQAFAEAQQHTSLAPKLLIVITTPYQRDRPVSDFQNRCQSRLEEFIANAPPCPFLRVSLEEPENAFNEISAAFQAMQPE